MSALLIIGAGGHGKVVADAAREAGRWQTLAFFDPAHAMLGPVFGLRVVDASETLATLRDQFDDCIVAIGDNARRIALLDEASETGFDLPVLVHPHAQVSVASQLGVGSVVMAGAVVQADSRIGRAGIINTGASVDHDCVIDDGVHVSPGAHLGGSVNVGELSWIGIGSAVCHGLTIGARVTIGAGAAVVRDIPDDVTAVGVPARVVGA